VRRNAVGVSLVSAEYYREHLRYLRAEVSAMRAGSGMASPTTASFHALCLMRSDAPDVTDGERTEAERLIDESAGLVIKLRGTNGN
jgi:hypothetical protein